MNIKEIFTSIENRSITLKQRKYLYAFCKCVLENESAGEDSLIWFNVYSALNRRMADWLDRRDIATIESRKELMRRSIRYLRSNKPNML